MLETNKRIPKKDIEKGGIYIDDRGLINIFLGNDIGIVKVYYVYLSEVVDIDILQTERHKIYQINDAEILKAKQIANRMIRTAITEESISKSYDHPKLLFTIGKFDINKLKSWIFKNKIVLFNNKANLIEYPIFNEEKPPEVIEVKESQLEIGRMYIDSKSDFGTEKEVDHLVIYLRKFKRGTKGIIENYLFMKVVTFGILDKSVENLTYQRLIENTLKGHNNFVHEYENIPKVYQLSFYKHIDKYKLKDSIVESLINSYAKHNTRQLY